MKKLIVILLMSIGVANAALPTNVGTNVARIVGVDYYCESYSTVGSIYMSNLIDAFGGVEAVSTDAEYIAEAITIHSAFLEHGSELGCATLRFLLKEVGLYDKFFE